MAIRIPTEEVDRAALQTLGQCDLSALTKLGVKGRDSEQWLLDEGIDVPAEMYDSRDLSDGGLVVRIGADEFLLESSVTNESVPALAAQLDSIDRKVFRVEREEATILLVGSRAVEVLAQTCGYNFREALVMRLVLTRVAGVSCGILPQPFADSAAYRIWVDPSFSVYLWETLVQICEDLGGAVVGAESVLGISNS